MKLERKIETSDTCIAQNQMIGDGSGFAALRDLYVTQSGERYSVLKTKWEFCSEPSHRPIKWRFILAEHKEGNA
jgi:hypothetical protein